MRDYLKDPEFIEEYNIAISGAVQAAMHKAQVEMLPAIQILKEIAADPEESAGVRVAASRALLEYGIKLTETGDILNRLDRLESEEF